VNILLILFFIEIYDSSKKIFQESPTFGVSKT